MNLNELVDATYEKINDLHLRLSRGGPDLAKIYPKERIGEVLRAALEIIADELEQGGEFSTPLLGRVRVRKRGASQARSLYIQGSASMKARLKRSADNGRR